MSTKTHRMIWTMGVWHCPDCGRTLSPSWRPGLALEVLVAGDPTALHVGPVARDDRARDQAAPDGDGAAPAWLLPTLERIQGEL